jgi:hypothetical protein
MVVFEVNEDYLSILLDGIGNHFGEVSILLICHRIEFAEPSNDFPDILGADSKHDHVVAEHGQLAEQEIFLGD